MTKFVNVRNRIINETSTTSSLQDVIQNVIFLVPLENPKIIPISIENIENFDPESDLSKLIERDMGSVHLSGNSIFYHQPY